jgi:hypothetical protein
MSNLGQLSGRERYRLLVSLLIIPLGAIIAVRAVLVGVQAWVLIVLGLAFVGLGIVRLCMYAKTSA